MQLLRTLALLQHVQWQHHKTQTPGLKGTGWSSDDWPVPFSLPKHHKNFKFFWDFMSAFAFSSNIYYEGRNYQKIGQDVQGNNIEQEGVDYS